MKNVVQLLTSNLLNDNQKLKEIDHWLSVMNRPQGWHYDMDIVWLLQELENSGIKKGDTILDAGAGMGVTQFILAARGFNVISLDYSHRECPKIADGIFDISILSKDTLNYNHTYMGSVDYGIKSDADKMNEKKEGILSFAIKTILKGRTYSTLSNLLKKRRNNLINSRERELDHSNFGEIKFIRAAFHDIPLEDFSVDAIVSVSAIEHADQTLMEKNIFEMKRVLKKGAPLLITTSATNQEKDVYHKKTLGWCYSKASLNNMAAIKNINKFNYKLAEKEILESKLWRTRIDSYYANDPDSEFFKKRIKKLPYLPVGVKIIK